MSVNEFDGESRSTGDSRVDDVVARLDEVDRVGPADQLGAFTDLQASLARVLDADADAEPARDPAG